MMKHLAILLLLASVAFGQQRVRPIDLTPETLTLIADSARAIVSDSLATATNYDSVRAIVSDSISDVTTAAETRGIVSDSLAVHDAALRSGINDTINVYFPIGTNNILNGGVSWDDLNQATKDSITASAGGTVNRYLFDNELLSQTASTDSDSVHISISGFGYSSAPDVNIVNKSNWLSYIIRSTASQVVIGLSISGVGVTSTFDLFFISND